MIRLDSMSRHDLDRAEEAWYDHLYDLYYGTDDGEEPWERDNPEWGEIADLVDAQSWEWICDTVRDYLEGDGDLMVEVYEAGLLADYIDPGARMDDPDDEWNEIDRVFSVQWQNNDLMKAIYIWLPEEHLKKMCEELLKRADFNGIRDLYNKEHEDDCRGMEEE